MRQSETYRALEELYDTGFNDGVNFMRNALRERRVHPIIKALRCFYPKFAMTREEAQRYFRRKHG